MLLENQSMPVCKAFGCLALLRYRFPSFKTLSPVIPFLPSTQEGMADGRGVSPEIAS